MIESTIRIFARVFRRKIANGMTFEEVSALYPKLTSDELEKIKALL